MKKQYAFKSQAAAAKLVAAALFVGSMLGSVGCQDLGAGPVSERKGNGRTENGGLASTNVLGEVALADGTRIEFVEVAGNVLVTAEFDANTANPLASIREEVTNLAGLYENLAGKPAPRALVDADQRLLAGGDPSARFGMPGPVVEEKSPATGPTISMTATAFENQFCSNSGFCLTNRTNSVSASRLLALSSLGAVNCVSGKVTATFSEKLLGLGPFITRFVRDVGAGKTLAFRFLYLLPTDVRLSVSPMPSGTYHLALR